MQSKFIYSLIIILSAVLSGCGGSSSSTSSGPEPDVDPDTSLETSLSSVDTLEFKGHENAGALFYIQQNQGFANTLWKVNPDDTSGTATHERVQENIAPLGGYSSHTVSKARIGEEGSISEYGLDGMFFWTQTEAGGIPQVALRYIKSVEAAQTESIVLKESPNIEAYTFAQNLTEPNKTRLVIGASDITGADTVIVTPVNQEASVSDNYVFSSPVYRGHEPDGWLVHTFTEPNEANESFIEAISVTSDVKATAFKSVAVQDKEGITIDISSQKYWAMHGFGDPFPDNSQLVILHFIDAEQPESRSDVMILELGEAGEKPILKPLLNDDGEPLSFLLIGGDDSWVRIGGSYYTFSSAESATIDNPAFRLLRLHSEGWEYVSEETFYFEPPLITSGTHLFWKNNELHSGGKGEPQLFAFDLINEKLEVIDKVSAKDEGGFYLPLLGVVNNDWLFYNRLKHVNRREVMEAVAYNLASEERVSLKNAGWVSANTNGKGSLGNLLGPLEGITQLQNQSLRTRSLELGQVFFTTVNGMLGVVNADSPNDGFLELGTFPSGDDFDSPTFGDEMAVGSHRLIQFDSNRMYYVNTKHKNSLQLLTDEPNDLIEAIPISGY